MTTGNQISHGTTAGRRSLRLVPRPRADAVTDVRPEPSRLAEMVPVKELTDVASSSEMVELPRMVPPGGPVEKTSPIIGTTRWTGAGLLLAGLWGGWLQPALSPPIRATNLAVVLPGLGRAGFLTWGAVVMVALLLAVLALVPWGNRRAVVGRMAAALSLGACIGFLAQASFVDVTLQQRLRRDKTDLADLQRIVGYKIPRPSVTTLGPIPIPTAAADVVSALQWGFYSAVVGALLLTIGSRAGQRAGFVGHPRDRLIVNWVTTVLLVCVAVTVIQSAVAGWGISRAESSAASGDDGTAVTRYRSALGRDSALLGEPDLLARFGISQLRLGPADGPASQLASSRLKLQAGKDLAALQLISGATVRWPGDPALQDEFTDQIVEYLRVHGTPAPVRVLVTSGNENALVRISLAKYELSTGDNPAAIGDARSAAALSSDDDVRSIALTYLSVAQSRSGNLVEGRQTLLDAVNADNDYVNVMARSILTGLYTTLPL